MCSAGWLALHARRSTKQMETKEICVSHCAPHPRHHQDRSRSARKHLSLCPNRWWWWALMPNKWPQVTTADADHQKYYNILIFSSTSSFFGRMTENRTTTLHVDQREFQMTFFLLLQFEITVSCCGLSLRLCVFSGRLLWSFFVLAYCRVMHTQRS